MANAVETRDMQIETMIGAKERLEERLEKWLQDPQVCDALRKPHEARNGAYVVQSEKVKMCA